MSSFISSMIRKQKVKLISSAVAVGAVLLIIAFQFLYSPLQQESLLAIDFRTSQSGSVALYYDTGMRFQERESQSFIIQGDFAWQTFTFPLPNKKINALRFDPPAVKDADFQIRDIRIINSQGKTLRRIDPKDVKSLNQIRHFERSDHVIQFQTDEISDDPQLLILPEQPIQFAWYQVLGGAFLLWLLIAGLGIFIALLLTFHTFRSERTRNIPKRTTLFVLAVIYLLSVWFLHVKISSCFLEASIKTTSAEMAKLYFDTGQGLSEGQTAALWVNSIDSFGRYRFPLPNETIYHLRFDPPSTNGTVIISNVLVTDGLGRIIRYIPLHQLYPLHQIEKSILQGDHLAITNIRNATDPQIGIHLQNPLQIPTSFFWGDPLFLTIILALWTMNLLLFKFVKKILYLVSLVGAMLAGGIPGRLIIGIHNVLQKTVDRFSRAERKTKTLWKFLLITGIFLGFFLFFFLRNHYYVPAKLHIEGFAQKPAAAVFQWDTGNGLNDYEATAFTVGSKLLEKIPHRVVIERTGEKQSSAQAEEVRVLSIVTDQQNSPKLASFAVPRVIDVKENGEIVLLQDQARIAFTETFQKITIKFLKDSRSGKVRIFIDDVRHGEYDLYAEQATDTSITIEELPTPELFVRELELPQLGVYGISLKTKDPADMFSLHALKIVSTNGEVKLPVNSGVVSNAFVYPRIDPQTAKFHWTLFTVQVFLAGLCTYFVILIFPHVHSRKQLRVTFLMGKRLYFWGMFIIAVCVYSLWLLGLWPGGMSNDSLSIWSQTISLNHIDDWSPYLYTLFILMLKQFYPNPAIVGISQIIFTALLGSAVFYYCVRKINALYVIPFYLGFILSIPIGLYNTTIWKDIPFSLAVVAMSFSLFKHAIENRASLRLSRINYVYMTLILIAILQFRHNGVLYYALLPILFWVIFPRTIWIRLSMIVIGIFIVFRFMLPSVLHITLVNKYPLMEIGIRYGSMIWIMSDPRYVSQDKSKDIEIMSRLMPWEEMKRNCDPCVSFMLASHPKFAYYPPEKIQEFNQLYRRLVIQNIHIFFAERTYQFFCHLDGGYYGTYSSNLPGRYLFGRVHLYNLIFHPRSQFLNQKLSAYVEWSLRYTGLLSPRNLIWNIIIPIMLLITMLLITGIRHPLSLLMLPTLVMVAALFFVTGGIDFRYFYFAYLLSIFLIPLCIVCKKFSLKCN